MKKVFSILLVLCVAVSLFAVGSVKVGGAFNFVTGGTRDLELKAYINGTEDKDFAYEFKKDATYKMNGFGFDLSGDFDVAQNLSVWADFNMVFGNDFKFKTEVPVDDIMIEEFPKDGDYYSLGKLYDEFKKEERSGLYKRFNIVSFGTGVAYKLALDPVDVKLGGGLFLDRTLGKVGTKEGDNEMYYQAKAVNFGLSLYANCNYKFNKNFGVGLTVMPHIGLYDSFSFKYYLGNATNNYEYVVSAKGFKLSFAMPVVLGVSYSF